MQSIITKSVDNTEDLVYINKGFVYPFPAFLFKYRKTVDAFLNKISDEYAYQYYDMSSEGAGIFIEVVSDNFIIYFEYGDEMIRCYGRCVNLEVCNKLNTIYKEVVKPELSELIITHYSFFLDGNCVRNSQSRLKDDFQPKKCYVPYIDTDEMFRQFFTGDENILLLVGKSGVGKSKLTSLGIRYLADNSLNHLNSGINNRAVASLNNSDILVLDDFWNTLKYIHTDLVILDDLDFMLGKRDDENNKRNKFLSHFLTFTDGFRKNRIKFIITTNQEYSDIDKAIIRKGRLFDVIEMRELTYDEGLKIWTDEGIQEPYPFKNSVTVADLAYKINRAKNVSLRKEYLLDTSVRKTNIGKRIGF